MVGGADAAPGQAALVLLALRTLPLLRVMLPARLQTRHWVITDANGKVEEVRGEGVVGEQPRLQPGESYSYSSGAVLETQVGTMRGAYIFHADDGTDFEVPIPEFVLSVPRTLH